MDYFEVLKTSQEPEPEQPAGEYRAHTPLPLPAANDVDATVAYIEQTCAGLYFTSDSDEPVVLYRLLGDGLQTLEGRADKLALPSASAFATFVAGGAAASEPGFVSERRPVGDFFARLCSQQTSERQRHLAASLEAVFEHLGTQAGADAAYYRVGIAPDIEVYVVMLVDGQVVGIKTLSVET
ncbi:hypothetical protein H4R18_002338 [Coemansia javaensis]|uniref:Uncharacterized protein n=1 Tax=Coemansia javaensis TaxID=2761396 RepID=A0A9W8HGZ9_9FUNG|nr:hypothetical protein H4R18_002338 [Coemansia javaensis]